MEEQEYLEYMSKQTVTVNTITYLDRSVGQLDKGVIVLVQRNVANISCVD